MSLGQTPGGWGPSSQAPEREGKAKERKEEKGRKEIGKKEMGNVYQPPQANFVQLEHCNLCDQKFYSEIPIDILIIKR
jgi:hypothetical protein